MWWCRVSQLVLNNPSLIDLYFLVSSCNQTTSVITPWIMDQGTCIKQLISKGTEEFIMAHSNSPVKPLKRFCCNAWLPPMSLLSLYQNMQLKSIAPLNNHYPVMQALKAEHLDKPYKTWIPLTNTSIYCALLSHQVLLSPHLSHRTNECPTPTFVPSL